MNRRRFLLGSSALVAAAAVAKVVPAGAIEFPPAPTSWGEVQGAALLGAETDFGGVPSGLLRAWSASLWDTMSERSILMSFVEGADGSVTVYEREPCPFVPFAPALAPPARLR